MSKRKRGRNLSSNHSTQSAPTTRYVAALENLKTVAGQVPKTTSIPEKRPIARVKAWAWRTTATYVWIHSILLLIFGHDVLSGTESRVAAWIVSFLSSAGFAPANGAHLGLVLVGTWLIFITDFSAAQLLIGFPLYVLVAPVALLGSAVFHRQVKASQAKTGSEAVTSPQPKKHFRMASRAVTLILGWLILYGGSTQRGPNIVGCFLAGVLFLTLVSRALGKTSRVGQRDIAALSEWALRGMLFMLNTINRTIQDHLQKKPQNAHSLPVTSAFVYPFRWTRLVLRPPRGNDRIAMMMLGEYIVFLLLLGAAATLFWALALKVALATANHMTLGDALTISASHFLPAINRLAPSSVPWWAEFGPAVTSWVLFVIYIGPVASALPVRQDDLAAHVIFPRRVLKSTVILWKAYRRLFKILGEIETSQNNDKPVN